MTYKILVVGPAWVGDMVMAQSLFKLIKQRQPDTVIDVLAPAWSQPILARMPEVASGIVMPIGHGQLQIAERFRIGRGLREKNMIKLSCYRIHSSLRSFLSLPTSLCAPAGAGNCAACF